MKITEYKKVDGLLQPGKVYNIFTARQNYSNRKYEENNTLYPGQSHHMRYEGKKGIHHFFTSILGGYTLTQTDVQLLGKNIEECNS